MPNGHARGRDVTAVSRNVTKADAPAGVVVRPADLTDPVATHDTCAGSDVVVMAANLPYRRWATELVSLVDNAHDRAVAETVAHLRGAQPP